MFTSGWHFKIEGSATGLFRLALKICGAQLLFFNVALAAPRSVSFEELGQILLRNNKDVITAQATVTAATLEQKTALRSNIPVLAASAQWDDASTLDTSISEMKAKQNVYLYNLGVTGKKQEVGFTYSVMASANNQLQQHFDAFPAVNEDGYELKFEGQLDFLQDSGARVGTLALRKASLLVKSAQAKERLAIAQQVHTLVEKYLLALLVQKKLVSNQELLTQYEQLGKRYQILYSEGKVSKIEKLTSEIEVQSQRATLLDLEEQRKEAIRDLFDFVGGFELERGDADLQNLQLMELRPDLLPGDRLSKIKKNIVKKDNPAVQSLDLEKRTGDLDVNQLQNKLLPSLKLVAGRDFIRNPNLDSFATPFSREHDQWYVALKFEMPLDRTPARIDIEAKKAEQAGVMARQKILDQSVDFQQASLFESLSQLESRLEVAVQLEQLSRDRYASTLPLIEKSSFAQRDIFDYQNATRERRIAISQLQIEIVRRRAEIFLLNGDLIIVR